jgi:hypothetical protein
VGVFGVSICMHFQSSFTLWKELMSGGGGCLTEERDQLLSILSLDVNWSRNGNSSLLVQFLFSSSLAVLIEMKK